ncbi:MAG: FG-GAP repeat domain-containing protein, partial [Flavobacteriaceae bacterium]
LNYKYQASNEKPFRVYLNDFDKNATYDIVLSYNSEGTEYPVRGRQCSSEQMPAIKEKFKDYNSFASASLEQIYSNQMLEESLKYEITSFSSLYLENKNGKFSASPLPYQAQLSNINAMVVKDIDSDGNLDVVLGGNLYNAEVETPRNDASYGLWLKGDGQNNFSAQNPRTSGLVIRGDVRNIKPISIADQAHLLIAKNNEALQLVKIN